MSWDHELILGDSYSPGVVSLEDENGDAFDITGATGVVQVKTEAGTVVAAFVPTVALVGDGTLGTFEWTSSAASTSALSAGKYIYAVRLTFADATIKTVVEGMITVRSLIT